jgi:hypothetical protein
MAGLVMALALVVLSGCFNPFDPQVQGVGITEPPPNPDSPGNLLRLLQWCYENRAIFEYRELFDNDYRFVFGVLDPDGNAYRTNPWTREDEVESTTHLFQGGDANQPAATSIVIIFDKTFRITDDVNHPGLGHKLIRTSVILRLTDANQTQREVQGFANFFMVRGDSASIPEELRKRGFGPDPNRWYIYRHEDDTLPEDDGVQSAAIPVARIASAPAADPISSTFEQIVCSWGALKHQYR